MRPTLDLERRLPLAGGTGLDLAFSPDGRLLAAGWRRSVYVFDTATWELVAGPPGHDGSSAGGVAGRRPHVATSGGDGTVALFDVERGLVRGGRCRPPPTPGKGSPSSCPSRPTSSSSSAANGPAGATPWSRRRGSTRRARSSAATSRGPSGTATCRTGLTNGPAPSGPRAQARFPRGAGGRPGWGPTSVSACGSSSTAADGGCSPRTRRRRARCGRSRSRSHRASPRPG